jgi:glycosyltransferase involved in cell wall biosynthesis
MKRIRISIGIPVYNEEQNIIALLNAIAKQRLISAVIEKVFVIN